VTSLCGATSGNCGNDTAEYGPGFHCVASGLREAATVEDPVSQSDELERIIESKL
jgi:hypothetical protein